LSRFDPIFEGGIGIGYWHCHARPPRLVDLVQWGADPLTSAFMDKSLGGYSAAGLVARVDDANRGSANEGVKTSSGLIFQLTASKRAC
jgi:hypothetical protein